ncbi:MAG: Na/Pi cotransporter family protein [Nitriliruptoraceae bacterium]
MGPLLTAAPLAAEVLEVPGAGADLPIGTMLMGLVGGLALFLYGMDGVTRGLKGLAGTSLSGILARLSSNRFSGVATGVLVTAMIQSSSVTVVLVIGFVSAGLLSLTASVGVILGANVGTTITAQIVAFDVVGSALWMVAAGVFGRYLLRRGTLRMTATALVGLGLLFLGMGVMESGMAPLRGYEPFLQLMATDRGPLPGVLIGAGLTALVQSSSATIGIVIVMASQGLIPLETGIALALGASLGTPVTALLATIGRPRVALRVALVHVLVNAIGVTILVLLIPWLAELARAVSPAATELQGADALAVETPRQIANAYTLAKTGMLVIFLPFTTQLARLTERLVPVRASEQRRVPRYLDDDLLPTPGAALELASREVDRMARKTLAMVDAVLLPLIDGRANELAEVAAADEEVDDLHDAIIEYLRRIDGDGLSDHERDRMLALTNVTTYLELVGDIVQHDLVRVGLNRIEEHAPFSPETREVLTDAHRTMRDLLAEAITAFSTGDAELAAQVLAAKPEVSDRFQHAAAQRVDRLGADAPARVAAFTRGTEILEHLRRFYTFAKRIARQVDPG